MKTFKELLAKKNENTKVLANLYLKKSTTKEDGALFSQKLDERVELSKKIEKKENVGRYGKASNWLDSIGLVGMASLAIITLCGIPGAGILFAVWAGFEAVTLLWKNRESIKDIFRRKKDNSVKVDADNSKITKIVSKPIKSNIENIKDYNPKQNKLIISDQKYSDINPKNALPEHKGLLKSKSFIY